jgi:SAM-dependent methyltransferase
MDWRIKAAAQNVFAVLPERLANKAYFRLQRRFGGWRDADPSSRFHAAIEIWRRCLQHGLEPVGRTFLEVGTGHAPNVPVALWLMGAGRVVTVDRNRYVERELIQETVAFLRANRMRAAELFGPLLNRERFDALQSADDVLSCIEYVAPCDASATSFESQSIDVHCSYTVLEHIPRDILREILVEARRLLRPDGLFVHCVDYSDHFSHGDSRLSPINFLRFSEREWALYAGNRFMYCNRMRHTDFETVLANAGLDVIDRYLLRDERVARDLETLPLHADFCATPREVLEVTGAWFVARAEQARLATG